VVTVLTPATTWTEGFTNRLIGIDYSENFLAWQPREMKNAIHIFWLVRLCAPPYQPAKLLFDFEQKNGWAWAQPVSILVW